MSRSILGRELCRVWEVICISCGVLQGRESKKFLVKSFMAIMKKSMSLFIEMLNKWIGGGLNVMWQTEKNSITPSLRPAYRNGLPYIYFLIPGQKPGRAHLATLSMESASQKLYFEPAALDWFPTPKDDMTEAGMGSVLEG